MRIKLKFVLILIMQSCHIIAQVGFKDGFIITLNNDTIYGGIKYNYTLRTIKTCHFYNIDKITEYYPSQIKGFGILNDKYFTSQIIDSTFLQVLIQGELSLYRDNFNLFIQKKGQEVLKMESKEKEVTIDGKVLIREDNAWKGLISILVFDCIQDIQKVQNLNLDERNLSRLVIDYNKCKGTYYKDFLAEKPWTKLELGFITGITHSTITNKVISQYNYLDNTYQSIDPSFGLLITISSPRFLKRVAFQSEAQIIQSDFYSEVINTLSSEIDYHDTYIDLTTLSLPISIKYTIKDGEYNLFLNTGVNYMNHLKWETKRISEQLIANVVYTSAGQALEINKQQLGFWCGIGLLKPFKKFKGGITFRYNRINKLNVEDFTSNLNSLSLSLFVTTK